MSSTDDVPMALADTGAGELLVWPWAGVLATTTASPEEDDTAVMLLASHARQHPAAVATTAVLQDAARTDTNRRNHFLVLHFGKSLSGLRAASSLGGRFDGAGRTEWHHQLQRDGESACSGAVAVYGWTAVEADLRGEDALGRSLSATGATTRSAEDAVAVEHERAARLLEARCEEAAAALLAAEEETSCLLREIAELRTIVDKIVPEMNREVEEENRIVKAALEEATKEIESKMEKIAQLGDLEKGAEDINTLELAPVGGGCKLGDHAVMLQENHKQEMEAIHSKLIRLEEQLEEREILVLMTRQLNMKLEAGEKLTEEDHRHLDAVTVYLDEELKRFKDSLLELYKRDEMNSKELQENRQELIQVMENMVISGRVTVGIKRMGQLDKRPFHIACKWKFRGDDPEGKAASLVSSWQEEIQKPSWHPFIEVNGEDKEVVDDNDPKLRQLRLECGDNVFCAVKAALSEINEYSPHGRHIVNEIWNFPEGRKATMTEAITYILEQLTVAGPGL